MRYFSLVDANDNEYDLTVSGKIFLNEPAGLGFAKNNNYIRLGGAYVRQAEEIYAQGMIPGELILSGYEEYRALTAYIYSGGELRIKYRTDGVVDPYYREIDIGSIDKGELGASMLLRCPVTFACRSRWYQTIQKSFVDQMIWQITNDGHFPASWRLTVDITPGAVIAGQIIELIQYGEDSSQTSLVKIALAKSGLQGRLVWDTRDGHASCTWGGVNMVSVMDFTKENFFKIPIGSYGFKIYGYTGGRTSGKLEIFKEYATV